MYLNIWSYVFGTSVAILLLLCALGVHYIWWKRKLDRGDFDERLYQEILREEQLEGRVRLEE